jgi:hypothetical protein
MPTSAERKRKKPSAALEFFYKKDGKKQDAALHEPILAEGDAAAAEKVGRAVMRRLGIKPERIEALMKRP